MKKSKILIQIALVLGIVLVLNLITSEAYFRLDFTADQRYTLSEATKTVLTEDVQEPVTIKMYVTEDLNGPLKTIRDDLEDLLIEYGDHSDQNVVYEFINPNESEESKAKAREEGIQAFQLNSGEGDKFTQELTYFGATIEVGAQKEVIGQFLSQRGVLPLEFTFTNTIKKLAVLDKPKIGLLQGHGEATKNSMIQVMQSLAIQYEVEEITLTDTSNVPAYLKALIIVDPSDTFPDNHLKMLDDYMEQGGNVYLSYNSVNINQQVWSAAPDIGIAEWLRHKGLTIEPKLVIDQALQYVSVNQFQSIPFPYWPIIQNFSDHPVSKGLAQVPLSFTNSISIDRQDSSVTATPLAFTTEESGIVETPVMFNVQKQWTESDFNQPSIPVAVALEGNIMGTQESKMIVIAASGFGVNGEGQQAQALQGNSLDFAVNSIEWLSDDSGLAQLRSKQVRSRPIDPVDPSTQTFLQYGNVLLPIILMLLYAFFRKQKNFHKKQAWIQGFIS